MTGVGSRALVSTTQRESSNAGRVLVAGHDRYPQSGADERPLIMVGQTRGGGKI